MADLETLAAQVAELRDLEEIKKLKYRYFRAMTHHDHAALKETLTEDVVTSYSDGKYVFEDREQLLAFLIDSHDPEAGILAYWMAGMPEITLQGDASATAIWAMYHSFYSQKAGFVDEMFVYYDDAYRKEEGVWRIAKTGYTRVINQILDRREMPYRMQAPQWAVDAEAAARGGSGD
ncbi:MAG: nuclear transport factor 2 family protein [Myxococcota bacterium]